jgi:hypothetical protein
MKEILVEHLLREGECYVKICDGMKTRISLHRIEDKKTCFGSKPQFTLGLWYNCVCQHTLWSYSWNPWQTHVDIHAYPPKLEPGDLIPGVAEMADYTISGNYTSIRIYIH